MDKSTIPLWAVPRPKKVNHSNLSSRLNFNERYILDDWYAGLMWVTTTNIMLTNDSSIYQNFHQKGRVKNGCLNNRFKRFQS